MTTEQIIKTRKKVAAAYCKKMGWENNPTKLTLEQIMEIRDQAEWREASGGNPISVIID